VWVWARRRLREAAPGGPELAMTLLRDSGVRLPADSPCAKALSESAGDHGTPGHLRALALATLVAAAAGAPAKLLRESMDDKDATVRAAAATAFAKPGAGR